MAKPTWLTLSTTTGTADGSFDMTAPQYKGRLDRSEVNATTFPDYVNGTVTVTTSKSMTATIAVDQYGIGNYLVNGGGGETIGPESGDETGIAGTSNGAALVFEVYDYATKTWKKTGAQTQFTENSSTTYQGESAPTVSFDGNYTVVYALPSSTTVSQANGASITNDPGSIQTYTFSTKVSCAENTGLSDATTKYRIYILGDEAHAVENTVTVKAGESFIKLYNEEAHSTEITSYDFATAGETKNVYVDSNDSWTVS